MIRLPGLLPNRRGCGARACRSVDHVHRTGRAFL